MMQMRTHTCGELRLSDAGKSVKIVGWMENIREVGDNFAFVILRDFYGTTQVVVESEEMMNILKDLNKESTISVEGVVRERASKNPKLPTGEIEVVPAKIEVLGRCRYNSLPFEINRSREADESQRLKYRYLDLRNPAVKNNIILRCQGGFRPAQRDDRARLHGDHHPHPDRLLARGRARLPGARAQASRQVLCAAPGAPAVQAAADGLRL